MLGFAIPVAGYFWLVGRYSFNVIVGDQFDDLTVIDHTYKHLFDWSALWAQHNENRVFFPNLIVVLLTRTTHFNVQVEEYLSAFMLVGSVALVIWAHKRRSPSTPWLYYCPVVILAFSIVQYDNTLWGFQLAWYLVLLSLAIAMVLLDRFTMTWIVMVGAIATAVVGSFSSLQGLLIWPAGLVLLYHRRRGPMFFVSWVAAAAATTVLYFYNFHFNSSSGILRIDFHHPSGVVRFFIFAIGEIVGFRVDRFDSGNRAVSTLGLVIVLLALAVLVGYGLRRDPIGGSPIGVALICFGLLFAGLIAEGRALYGYAGAGASRYTTIDLLVPIGIYLALLGRPSPFVVKRRVTTDHSSGLAPRRLEQFWNAIPAGIDRIGVPTARWIIAAVIVIQIPLGVHYGLEGARERYGGEVVVARVLRDFHHASAGDIDLLYLSKPTSFIRHQVGIAEKYHLSLFDEGSSR